MDIFQIGILGAAGALLALQFKGGKSEYGIYMGVAVSLFVFGCIVSRLGTFLDMVRGITSYINADAGYLAMMLKMLGIAYLSEFSAGICRDAGCQTAAGQIEIFGRITILVMGMPVLTALLDTIREFLS